MSQSHPRQNICRPELTSKLEESDFVSWYWLKSELVNFCRDVNIPASGSKIDLNIRIAAYLGKRAIPFTERPLTGLADAAPENLHIGTVVTPGFRLSRKLRAFFEEYESGFHFNQALRDFFKAPAGRTLGEALAIYRRAKLTRTKAVISIQFEYNRHIREFFLINKDATMCEARAAWWEKRLNRKN